MSAETFQTKCTECGNSQRLPDEFSGREAFCSACGMQFIALPLDAGKPEIDPDSLLIDMRQGPTVTRLLTISFVVHLVIIAVFSVPYLFNVLHYKTFDVKTAKALEMETLRKEQVVARKEEKEQAREKLKKEKKNQPEKNQQKNQNGSKKTERVDTRKDEVIMDKPTGSDIDIDADFE